MDLKGYLQHAMGWFLFRRLLRAKWCAAAWRYLGATIAPDAFISPAVWMRKPSNVTIGPGCKLAGLIKLDGLATITFEPNVLVNSAQFHTGSHDIDSPYLAADPKPIHVGEYVWIVHNVIILHGITIGRAAVVGTGSVVTKDVPEYAVVGGNPARFIRERAHVDFYYVPSGAWQPPEMSKH